MSVWGVTLCNKHKGALCTSGPGSIVYRPVMTLLGRQRSVYCEANGTDFFQDLGEVQMVIFCSKTGKSRIM